MKVNDEVCKYVWHLKNVAKYFFFFILEFPVHRSDKKSQEVPFTRVWKGIFGIRDLTKIQCGIRENAKYFDGIRELTTSREAGLKRIWARDAGILARLLGIREIFTA